MSKNYGIVTDEKDFLNGLLFKNKKLEEYKSEALALKEKYGDILDRDYLDILINETGINDSSVIEESRRFSIGYLLDNYRGEM